MSTTLSKILYVDDENINLINFREALCDQFDILTAISGEEALTILEKEKDIALVVSDQRMPGIDGVTLLAKVRELLPYAERIITTAYTEPHDLIAAINNGHVYRYILKPWTEEDMQVTIPQAVQRYRYKQDIRELVDELNRKNLELEDKVSARTAELAKTNRTLTTKVKELERTRYELQTLRGILSICCYCKKMRNADNVWLPLEQYLLKHADILLSHGICPDCYPKVMKEMTEMTEMTKDEAVK